MDIIHTPRNVRYSALMNTTTETPRGSLIRAVVILQLKLLLSALRDLVLIPLALIAALFDFMRSKTHEPRHFRAVLRLGEFSDRWIDMWYHNDPQQAPRENVDALLSRVEEVVRDRKEGARQARVLKRWAERQMQRAKQRAAQEVATRMKAISDKRDGNEKDRHS
jgi:hypothetical protein